MMMKENTKGNIFLFIAYWMPTEDQKPETFFKTTLQGLHAKNECMSENN